MSIWSKLGKIGLAAAPYVAAPFTGGASLLALPATNKALGAWQAKDANKRAEQGLGPTKFDKILGMGSSIAGMAGGMGALGKFGGGGSDINTRTPPFVGNSSGGGGTDWGGMINGVVDRIGSMNSGGGGQRNPSPGIGPSSIPSPNQTMGRMDQSNPNLAYALSAGRNQALADQPWRKNPRMYN